MFFVFISLLFFNISKAFWKMADSKRCRRKSCVWIGTKALKRQEHSTSLLHRTIVRGSHCGGQGHRREARAAPLPAWGRTSARKQWGSTHRAVLSARPPRPQPEEDQVQGWAVDTEAGQSGKSSWRNPPLPKPSPKAEDSTQGCLAHCLSASSSGTPLGFSHP